MVEKYLNNRFLVIYFIPFVIGALTTLSFQPYNFVFVNFLIFPLFLYLAIHINKKSKSIYLKKPYKKICFFLAFLLVLVFI